MTRQGNSDWKLLLSFCGWGSNEVTILTPWEVEAVCMDTSTACRCRNVLPFLWSYMKMQVRCEDTGPSLTQCRFRNLTIRRCYTTARQECLRRGWVDLRSSEVDRLLVQACLIRSIPGEDAVLERTRLALVVLVGSFHADRCLQNLPKRNATPSKRK